MSMVETPENVIKESQQMINSFIWGNGPARVKQKSLIAPYEFGGLKSPDILSKIKALRIAWISRFSESAPWCSIANIYFSKYGGIHFLKHCNYNLHTLSNLSNFYRNMLMYLKEIYPNPTSFNIIWNNKDILVDD